MEQSLTRNRNWSWSGKNGLPELIEALPPVRPEMQALTEAGVRAALEEDEGGEIAAELSRLMCLCFLTLRDALDARGPAPLSALALRTRFPIEKVALEMTVKYIRELSKTALH